MDVRNQVKDIVCEIMEIEPSEIQDNENFSEKGSFDSIAALDVLTKLEKTFKIKIPETALIRMKNINCVIEVVEEIVNK